jgi:MFS family permease
MTALSQAQPQSGDASTGAPAPRTDGRLLTRFPALKVRNYRLYFFGQLLSQPGTYIQTIGQSWLVLHLTNSGADLGLVLAAQYLPVLFFGAWGGVVADRFDNRKIMIATQSTAGFFATCLGITVLTGEVRLWMVMVLAAGFGFVMVCDSPARQSFASEMVGADQVANAVALSMIFNSIARIIGPSIGAGLIAFAGIGYCFVVNGVSYFAVVIALIAMDKSKIFKRPKHARTKGQLRQGFAHIGSRPALRDTLIMLGIMGMVSSGMQIMMPLLAVRTFHGNATTFALFSTFMGLGAVIGGVLIARARQPSMRAMGILSGMFVIGVANASVMPDVVLELVVFTAIGAVSTMFTVIANTTLQQRSDPEMRGRVMALWAVALLGTQPISAPIFGVIVDHVGPRETMVLVAVVATSISAIGFRSARLESRLAATTALVASEAPSTVVVPEVAFATSPVRHHTDLELKEA